MHSGVCGVEIQHVSDTCATVNDVIDMSCMEHSEIIEINLNQSVLCCLHILNGKHK